MPDTKEEVREITLFTPREGETEYWYELQHIVGSIASELPELACNEPEQTPVDLALRSWTKRSPDIPALAGDFDALIESTLASRGIVPCRKVRSPVPGYPDPVEKIVYYRPTEQKLFDAIDDSHPIILATTLEPQRYVDAIRDHFSETAKRRPIFLWKGAAGIGRIFRVDAGGKAVQFSAAFADLSDSVREMPPEVRDPETARFILLGITQPSAKASKHRTSWSARQPSWKVESVATIGQ